MLQIPTTPVLCRHYFPGRSFDERRPTEKDGPIPLDNDGLVRHGGDVTAHQAP